jgi:BASS family bile acid:Na+ symporter
MNALDQITIKFSTEAIGILNVILGFIMYGVALSLKMEDFSRIFKSPKPALVGIFSQFLALPALTYLLVIIIRPQPSVALGMMLVAACPGGNISNFFSLLSRGNAALSVTLTAFASIFAIFMTPFNLLFWAGLYGPTNEILTKVEVAPEQVFKTIVLILIIPLVLGMLTNRFLPKFTEKIKTPTHYISLMMFAGLVIFAFSNNFNIFIEYIHLVLLIVFVHNLVALSSGYSLGALFKLNFADRKTLAIETGIQNSGFGLLLIFQFFDGLGGMAIIAAWWGIWHILAGLTIGYFWSGKFSPAGKLAN